MGYFLASVAAFLEHFRRGYSSMNKESEKIKKDYTMLRRVYHSTLAFEGRQVGRVGNQGTCMVWLSRWGLLSR